MPTTEPDPRDRRLVLAASGLALLGATAAAGRPAAAQSAAPANPALARPSPENAVLVYVDYVTGLDNLMNTLPARQFRNNIAAFAKFSPLFRMPTAVFGEENAYYGTFLPEIAPLVANGATRFERTRVSCYVPAFAEWLRATGRRHVVVGGISLDNCTMHTTLDLLREGYSVHVIADVSCTNSRLAEEAALMRLDRAGAVVTNWLSTLTEIGDDFAGPYGQGMMAIIREHWPASTVGEVQDLSPDGRGFQAPDWVPRRA